MNNLKKFSFVLGMIMLSGLILWSCSKSEKSFSSQFSVKRTEISASMRTEVLNYIDTRCSELNKSGELAHTLEQKNAESIFNTFCKKLADEIKEKGYRVFADTWVNLKLSDISNQVNVDQKVSFVKTSEPKHYVSIILRELAPTGNTLAATAYLEGLLSDLSLKKETKVENEITTNTYSFYKEYPSAQETLAYFEPKKANLDKLISKIEKGWPIEIVYTGKVEMKYECVNEVVGEKEYFNNESYITLRPHIHVKPWSTMAENAPFTSVSFSPNKTIESPFFLSYKLNIDNSLTSYTVIRLGTVINVLDNNTSKYMFRVQDSKNIQLIFMDGKDITNGPLYTVQN